MSTVWWDDPIEGVDLAGRLDPRPRSAPVRFVSQIFGFLTKYMMGLALLIFFGMAVNIIMQSLFSMTVPFLIDYHSKSAVLIPLIITLVYCIFSVPAALVSMFGLVLDSWKGATMSHHLMRRSAFLNGIRIWWNNFVGDGKDFLRMTPGGFVQFLLFIPTLIATGILWNVKKEVQDLQILPVYMACMTGVAAIFAICWLLPLIPRLLGRIKLLSDVHRDLARIRICRRFKEAEASLAKVGHGSNKLGGSAEVSQVMADTEMTQPVDIESSPQPTATADRGEIAPIEPISGVQVVDGKIQIRKHKQTKSSKNLKPVVPRKYFNKKYLYSAPRKVDLKAVRTLEPQEMNGVGFIVRFTMLFFAPFSMCRAGKPRGILCRHTKLPQGAPPVLVENLNINIIQSFLIHIVSLVLMVFFFISTLWVPLESIRHVLSNRKRHSHNLLRTIFAIIPSVAFAGSFWVAMYFYSNKLNFQKNSNDHYFSEAAFWSNLILLFVTAPFVFVIVRDVSRAYMKASSNTLTEIDERRASMNFTGFVAALMILITVVGALSVLGLAGTNGANDAKDVGTTEGNVLQRINLLNAKYAGVETQADAVTTNDIHNAKILSVCNKRWGELEDLDIIDIGSLAMMAYSEYSEEADSEYMTLWKKLMSDDVGDSVSSAKHWKEHGHLSSEKQVVKYQYYTSPDRKLHVVAIRGTKDVIDMYQDIDLFFEAGLYQVFALILPILTIMPENYISRVAIYVMGLPEAFSDTEYRKYYEPIVKKVNEIKDAKANDEHVLIVGHSLGGALAKIAAAKTATRAVAFNAPGLIMSRGKFELDRDLLTTTALTIKPRADIVSKVDEQSGDVQLIPCSASFGLINCHFMSQTRKTLSEYCGYDI